jgi:DNA-directed RNA polymerase subunit RPC12/RpoP
MTTSLTKELSNSIEATNAFIKLGHRIAECTVYYKSKKEAMSDLRMLNSKYADYNINWHGRAIPAKVEIDHLYKIIDNMVDTKCSTCSKSIVVKDHIIDAEHGAKCFECEHIYPQTPKK